MKNVPVPVEVAIKDLLKVCKENSVSVTGAIENKSVINNFICSKAPTESEEFKNIKTLNLAKGEIGIFLCELSKVENIAESNQSQHLLIPETVH